MHELKLRISDVDRDRAAAALHTAVSEGRLTWPEHEERVGRVYSARTGAELAPLLADLPQGAQSVLPAFAPAVSATPMLVVGLIGLAVNGVGLIMLRTGSRQSINIRGAYLEVLGDAAGSVGVIIAGLLIRWTGSSVWDVVVAVVIGVFVLIRAVGLGRSVIRVLGQHAPEGVDPAAVEADLAAVPGVIEVHDLHLWSLTSGMNVATAHLVSAPEADNHAVLDAATKVLASAHHIEHATLQVEPADHSSCGETAW